MPKRSSKSKSRREAKKRVRKQTDTATSAPPAKTNESTEATDDGKNPAAVALGRLGGLKGGAARAKKLSARRRSEIAKKAAQARWKKHKNK